MSRFGLFRGLAGSLYYLSGRIRAGFVECVGRMLIGDLKEVEWVCVCGLKTSGSE